MTALKAEPVAGIDPELGLVEISGALEAASLPAPHAVDWARALTAGQLALGHELVGAAQVAPCSNWRVPTRSSGSSSGGPSPRSRRCDTVWPRHSSRSTPRRRCWRRCGTTRRRRARRWRRDAGRSARTVARHSQQVLAGIGFTVEHPVPPLYFFRTAVNDQLLGAGSALTRQLGADVLASGTFPASFPL